MEIRTVKNLIFTIALMLFALIITQCASKPQVIKEDDEAVLRRRIEGYWNSRIKGEWDKCYEYVSPDDRKKLTLVAYVLQNSRSMIKLERYEIMDLWASGDEGHVKLDLKFRYLIPRILDRGVFGRVTGERWEKKDGQWYRLYEEMI